MSINNRSKKRSGIKGFTFLELAVVAIIVGILASLGLMQFTKTIEKSRTAEAKAILSTIRSSEHLYKQQFGAYTSDINDLALENAAPACAGTHYYSYSLDAAATMGIATRCDTGKGGKAPDWSVAYTINLNFTTGEFSGSDELYY